MKLHKLKIWPQFFKEVKQETKLFELRKDDRGFAVGDILRLQEWNPDKKEHTGKDVDVKVTYILKGMPGIEDGYCIMGISTETGIGWVCRNWCAQFPRNCAGVRGPCECDDFRGII